MEVLLREIILSLEKFRKFYYVINKLFISWCETLHAGRNVTFFFNHLVFLNNKRLAWLIESVYRVQNCKN